MRKTVFVACGTTLLLGLLVGPANATPAAKTGCPNGYEPATYEQLLTTPEVIAAARDGVYFADHVEDVFTALDQNRDGLVCYKSVANDGNTQFMVYYAGRYVENHAGTEK